MTNIKELTLRGMILGAFITVIFTASNVYLGLKVGLTFSSAIPAAVISMSILRFFRGSTLLENNMVQTEASAAGTLSSIIFVLPGLLMIGYWHDFPFWSSLFVCASGGILGVLFSIPLRYAMVVKSDLPYPEGVAAAEILKAGNNEEASQGSDKDMPTRSLNDIIFGGVISSVIGFFTSGLRLLSDSASYWFTSGQSIIQLPLGFSLALLSAGYLIGILSGIAILIGTFIAWGVAIPYLTAQIGYTTTNLSGVAMDLWSNQVRYIGAGTLAIAALWTLLTLIKPIIEGLQMSFRTIKLGTVGQKVDRMEQDLSPKTILAITLLIVIVMIGTFYNFVSDSRFSGTVAWGLVLGAVAIAFILGFLVAAACGYMAGLVGSSASPISGIGIIAVTIISLVFAGVSKFNGILVTAEDTKFAIALTLFATSAVFAIASISNDNLQDLKTGYLLKATPWRQQVALIIGCIIGALVIAPILDILYRAYGFTGALPVSGMDLTQVLAAPQATIMKTIAQGIFAHNLEWNMIIIGIILGAVVICIDILLGGLGSRFRLPALAVGMGIYLPPTVTTPLILGTVLSWWLRKRVAKLVPAADYKKAYQHVDRRAALIASGLIVGESLVGVLMAIIIVFSLSSGGNSAPLSVLPQLTNIFGTVTPAITQIGGVVVFIFSCTLFIRRALSAIKSK